MAKLLAAVFLICAFESILGCSDRYSSCSSYDSRKSYYCKYSWWKQNCEKFCGLCTAGDCRDVSSNCASYKASGYCATSSINHNTMKRVCQKTCNFCPGHMTTMAPTTRMPITAGTTIKPATSIPGSCGVSSVTGRVIAGVDSKPGQWPWQIAMLNKGRFGCGGSLITPQWVLTAAHCVYRRTASTFKIVLGEHNRGDKTGHEQRIPVEHVIWHPDYKKPTNINNDIALMKLSRPAELNQYVRTVCLPKHGETVSVGTKCFISGWGKTRHPGGSVTKLQHASLQVISKSECTRLNSKYVPVTDKMVCAANRPSRQSGCHGDSGGPFVCQQADGTWKLHGAVSWGSPRCDISDANTVFARISEFRNWIDETISKY